MGYPNELSDLSLLVSEPPAACFLARVEHVDDERVDLMLAGTRIGGRRAVSCLIALQAGDTVSVIRDGEGVNYVTAVLKRENAGELELSTRRPLLIRSASRVRLNAATALEFEAGERLRLTSPLLETLVGKFAAFTKSLYVVAGEALLNSKISRLCSELVDVAAQRIGVSARHSHRQIDGTEQLRCSHLDIQATELAHIRAKATLVKAEDLVKIDAAQIQIG